MLKTKRSKILRILEWCQKNLGQKVKTHYPKLHVYNSDGSSISGFSLYGHYDNNRNIITVFLKTHKNLLSLCDTVIHEFNHFLIDQEDRYAYTKIHLKMKRAGFSEFEITKKHPHEKKCNKIANKYAQLCYMQIKRNNK